MDQEIIINLEKFYEKLLGNYLLNSKNQRITNFSLLTPFISMTSNNALRLLSESSLEISKIPSKTLKTLIENKLIRETDEVHKYSITALGIYLVEKHKEKMSEEALADIIDKKFFNIFNSHDETLDDMGKVILFAMIAARTFSEKSPVNLKRGTKTQEAWLNILTRSFELLKSISVINEQSITDIFGENGKKGNESAVSYRFRRTDYLQKVTKRIYNAPGNQKYYLDLYDGQTLKIKEFQFIIKKIFNNNPLTSIMINKIIEFFKDIANTQDKYIFDMNEHIFSGFEYDKQIKDILINS